MLQTIRVDSVAAVVVVAAGAVLFAQQPSESTPTQVFTGGIEVVQVDVSVLDRKRQPITGLTTQNFTVLENGTPRPVVSFAAVTLPPTDVPPVVRPDTDVATNAIGRQEGRLVVVMLDRTIAPGWAWSSAKRVATETVEQLGPGDLGAVVTWNGTSQNVTTDRALLLRTIERADPSGTISEEAQEIEERTHTIAGQRMFNALGDGRCMCGTCGLDSIRTVADAVSDVSSRRKLLIFIGANLIFQDASSDNATESCGFSLRQSRKAMFDALERSNLTVHSFDPTGLETWQARSDGFAAMRLAMIQRQDSLRVLPDFTGGRAVVNTNGPEDQVHRVFSESRSYYLLGFEPAPSGSDDERRARTIEVRVDAEDARVYARRQYELPAAGPTPDTAGTRAGALARALNGLLPSAGVPMDLHVASFAMTGTPKAVVTISADVAALAPSLSGVARGGTTPLELVAGAFDHRGRPVASSRQRLELSWPDVSTNANRSRVEALSALELEPGSYEVRVAAMGADPARVASVFTHITVPDYGAAPLSLSHVVVGAGSEANAVPRDFLAGALPVVPTAQRALTRGTDTIAFLQIYQATMRRTAIEPVAVRVRIFNARNEIVREQETSFVAGDFRPYRTANARLTLPVRILPPGDYVLDLEAATTSARAERRLRFEVR